MIRTFLPMLALCAFLTGCANYQQQQAYTQMTSGFQTELAAWDKAQKIGEKECPSGKDGKPLPREKAMEAIECFEKIQRQYVIPVALAPDLTNEYFIEMKKVSLEYKKFKIDRDEANVRKQEVWQHYTSAINARASSVMNQAALADSQRAAAFRETGRTLLQASPSTSTTTTNCIENPMGFSCTSNKW